MEEIFGQAYRVIRDAVSACTAECISLSGGLDSTIIAHFLKPERARAVSVISEDFVANDLTYCQMAAQKFSIPLSIKMCQIDEVYSGIEETIRILGNFNDIEIRNSVVVYLAIYEAKNMGFDRVITGDGADEVFAGYNFLINKNSDELKSELARIAGIMHFPSQKIGKALGVTVESPFCSENVLEFAKGLPADLLVNTHDGKRFGKWILRKAFEEKIPRSVAWRQKSPMQAGAGTQGLTEFFERLIPDATFDAKTKKIKEDEGITIRTKESLQYYEIFSRHHRIPKPEGSGVWCPDCNFRIGEKSRFCRMCGRFPI